MISRRKRYATTCKKKVAVARDPCLPRRSPGGILWCTDCGATCDRRGWTLNPTQEVKARVESMAGVSFALCPACRKIRDGCAAGKLEAAA